MGDYANPEALVSTQWVADNLGGGPAGKQAGIKLVEVDEDTDAYERGHIPGAVSLHWRKELQDPVMRDFVGKQQKKNAANATINTGKFGAMRIVANDRIRTMNDATSQRNR